MPDILVPTVYFHFFQYKPIVSGALMLVNGHPDDGNWERSLCQGAGLADTHADKLWQNRQRTTSDMRDGWLISSADIHGLSPKQQYLTAAALTIPVLHQMAQNATTGSVIDRKLLVEVLQVELTFIRRAEKRMKQYEKSPHRRPQCRKRTKPDELPPDE